MHKSPYLSLPLAVQVDHAEVNNRAEVCHAVQDLHVTFRDDPRQRLSVEPANK
jgi:hypothetical protein